MQKLPAACNNLHAKTACCMQQLAYKWSSSTVIAALEGARECKAPVMIQVSQGGAAFFAGKGVKNGNQEASIGGAVAAAMFVR